MRFPKNGFNFTINKSVYVSFVIQHTTQRKRNLRIEKKKPRELIHITYIYERIAHIFVVIFISMNVSQYIDNYAFTSIVDRLDSLIIIIQ